MLHLHGRFTPIILSILAIVACDPGTASNVTGAYTGATLRATVGVEESQSTATTSVSTRGPTSIVAPGLASPAPTAATTPSTATGQPEGSLSMRTMPPTAPAAVAPTPSATLSALGGAADLECPPRGSLALRFLQMVAPSRGFALDVGGRLLRTSDGGSGWQATGMRLTPSVEPAVATVPPAGIAVAGRDGAAEALLIASLHEEAVRRVALPAAVHGVSGVAFSDSRHGWVLANLVGAMGSEAFDLFRTTDGGASWVRLAGAGPRRTSPGQAPFGGDESGISFRDASVGWLTGGFNTLGTSFFFRTDDGGRTLRDQFVPVPPGYQPDSSQLWTEPPRLFGRQDGVLPMTALGGPPTLVVYATHDGGATWHPTTPIRGAMADGRFVWYFLDTRQGWATNGGPLWRTRDGGVEWTSIQPNVSLAHARQLEFVDADRGWVVLSGAGCHDGQLLMTGDGGRTRAAVAVHPAR